MLTLGVDLASQRKRTATWNGYGDFDDPGFPASVDELV